MTGVGMAGFDSSVFGCVDVTGGDGESKAARVVVGVLDYVLVGGKSQ